MTDGCACHECYMQLLYSACWTFSSSQDTANTCTKNNRATATTLEQSSGHAGRRARRARQRMRTAPRRAAALGRRSVRGALRVRTSNSSLDRMSVRAFALHSTCTQLECPSVPVHHRQAGHARTACSNTDRRASTRRGCACASSAVMPKARTCGQPGAAAGRD